jgi:PleD family two-component response regulator
VNEDTRREAWPEVTGIAVHAGREKVARDVKRWRSMRETEARLRHTRHVKALARTRSSRAKAGTQRALIVNGNRDVLHVLEPVLDAGRYDVVFVESTEHAYSQVRRVQPDLVILCLAFDDAEGLSVLSMLKLDASTRDIPVITYTTPTIEDDDDDEVDEDRDLPLFVSTPPPSHLN